MSFTRTVEYVSLPSARRKKSSSPSGAWATTRWRPLDPPAPTGREAPND